MANVETKLVYVDYTTGIVLVDPSVYGTPDRLLLPYTWL